MKIAPRSPLGISLRWDAGDVQPVGRLAFRDGVAWLEYEDAFLKSGLELSPVHHAVGTGLHTPHRPEVFEGLHGVFHDSLPDGWGRLLVDRRARQLDIEPATLTPLDRLACVGDSGIGALCYAPATDVWGPGDDTIDLEKLSADAGRVLEGEAGDVLSALGRVGGSPGGARPKALLALNDEGRAVHGVDTVPEGYEHFIVKFRGRDDPEDIARIELAFAAMAKEAGVDMPETRLIEDAGGGMYFAARRFDRAGTRRVHVHSASGLLYSDIRLPALDYRDLILLTRSVTRDRRECVAMFTLAVFNVLAHNRDDHARQFSFTMARDGSWRLSPAYDLTCSTGPGGEHSSTVLGQGQGISRRHLIELGGKADLNERDAAHLIEKVEHAVGGWKRHAIAAGVSRQSTRNVSTALDRVRLR